MGFKTHYDNLKVSRTATKDEIKKSYRRLCSKHHPDKYPEQERERQNKILVIINKAYTILSNDTLRKQHDEWIRQQERSGYNTQQEAYQREQKAREEQKRKEEELKKQREEKLRKEAQKRKEEERKQKIREDILAQQRRNEELRREQELQAAKEAAIKKAKQCKEDKERKLINIITGVISLIVIMSIIFKLAADDQTNTPTKPTYTYDVPMKIIKITRDIVNDRLVTDVYFDNHRDDITVEQLKDLLKGSLSHKEDCNVRVEDQHRVKYQYVFHFVKGGKRIYLTAPLDRLCKKDYDY